MRCCRRWQRSASLAEHVYRTLREGIADGRLAPGSKITERELAAALDVSPTPVREALSKLQLEGLVERVGPRRMQIVDHPDETLHELMEVEVMLRAAEARFAARKIDAAAIARMRAYIDELVAARDSLTLAEQYEMAQRFDAEIAAAAANPALRTLIESYAIFGADIAARPRRRGREGPRMDRRAHRRPPRDRRGARGSRRGGGRADHAPAPGSSLRYPRASRSDQRP